MQSNIRKRVKSRLSEDFENGAIDDVMMQDYITTACDRIRLRLGVDQYPDEFDSIAVEIVIKIHRRNYHEGISSENVDTLSTSFVDDILDEYSQEFETYKKQHNRQLVRFI